MLDLVAQRAKLIAGILVALALVLAVKHFTAGESTDPTGQTQVVASRHVAEDAAAKTLLQTGSLGMEALFAQTGSYATGADGAAAMAPGIGWVPGAQAQAASNQVAVTADAVSYTLSTTSAGGTTFTWAKDATGMISRGCGAGCAW